MRCRHEGLEPDVDSSDRGRGPVMDTEAAATDRGYDKIEPFSALRRRQSALQVVPLLVETLIPASVIDVGCRSPEWLSVFSELGVSDLAGVDFGWGGGSEVVSLLAAAHKREFGQPLKLDREFDIALCLDAPESIIRTATRSLVEGAISLAPIIVLAAPVPAHESSMAAAWPSRWTMLFEGAGYQSFFGLRHAIWENDDVELRYRQSIVCYCARNRPQLIERMAKLERDTAVPVDVVHPDLHVQIAEDLAKSRRLSERLEHRVRDAAKEIDGLKAEVQVLTTKVKQLKNYAPLRAYRSLKRMISGGKKTRTVSPAAQRHERGDQMTNLAKLIDECPHFHAWADGKPANWAVPPGVLRFICDHVKPGMHTLETGAGQTTVAFAIADARHIAITPDSEQIRRIQSYLAQNGLEMRVAFMQGSSDTVLASGGDIPERLDFVFIDGAHRFPFPIIDWHYTAARVPVNGIVAVDDCRMPSVRILHDFLAAEDDWELFKLIHVTAFFRRVRDTVNVWDWADQRINKPHLDMLARRSEKDGKDASNATASKRTDGDR
jgi:hypothetical protein